MANRTRSVPDISPHWLWKIDPSIRRTFPADKLQNYYYTFWFGAPRDHSVFSRNKGPMHWYDTRKIPFRLRNNPSVAGKWDPYASPQFIDHICSRYPKRRLCRSDLTTFNVYQYLSYCWDKKYEDFPYRSSRFSCDGLVQDGWNDALSRPVATKLVMKKLVSYIDEFETQQQRSSHAFANLLGPSLVKAMGGDPTSIYQKEWTRSSMEHWISVLSQSMHLMKNSYCNLPGECLSNYTLPQ